MRVIERERVEAGQNARLQTQKEDAEKVLAAEHRLSEKDQEIRQLTSTKRLHSLVIAAERQRSRSLSQKLANANENTAEQLTELRSGHNDIVRKLEARVQELSDEKTNIENLANTRWYRLEEYRDLSRQLELEKQELNQKLHSQGKKLTMDRTLNFLMASVLALVLGGAREEGIGAGNRRSVSRACDN